VGVALGALGTGYLADQDGRRQRPAASGSGRAAPA
jgi:hypothetical protein